MSISITSTQLKRSDSNFESEINKIVEDLTSQTISLADIVTRLENYFCSVDLDDREEGIQILSIILKNIAISSLKHDEIVHLCAFYKFKLHDNHKLLPSVLNGILSLSEYDLPMNTNCFSELLTTLFQHVSCQVQQYNDRIKIYKLFRNLLRNQTQELLNLGPDLVYGVISAIDGERDPGNLLFLFNWLPEFICSVKLGHLWEEMHECMACYFPIDFRVPAHQANGIDRDKLAEALKSCLCASSEFSELTIALALEKLDTDLQIAKYDSLHLLLYSCKKFNLDIYIKYQAGIWSLLQKELLKFPSPELENLLLTTITAISQKLSTDTKNFDDIFDKILETNVNNLNWQEKFFAPICKLFLAMSKGNELCAQRILNEVQPRLINLYNITSTKGNKHLIFNVLIEFIKVGDRFNSNITGIPQFLLTNLVQNVPESQTLSLEALCHINNQFDEVKQFVIEQWGKIFIEEVSEKVRKSFHDCLLHYAERCYNEIILLIEGLCLDNFYNVMSNLCYLSSTQPFTEQFVKFFTKYYHLHREICLKLLNESLTLHKNNDALFKTIETSNIINEKIMNANFVELEEELVHVREILMKIIAKYSTDQQKTFIKNHLMNVITGCNINVKVVYYLSGIITNLHVDNLEENALLNKLFEISCNGNQVAVELLANMTNKLPEEVISGFILNFESYLKKGLLNQNLDNLGIVVIWLTKAVYMRGYHDKHRWIDLLMEYLPNTEIISTGMKTIMSDECPSLSPESHARRKLLYKQQFFIEICQKLNESFPVDNKNCIIAFASLISEVPSVTMKMNIEKSLKLVIFCLDNSTEAAGIIPILETIKNLIESKDKLSETYMEEFLPRLIILSRFPNCMKVRILALQCLRMYINGSIPIFKLLVHKSEVTNALGLCVDDKKRLVRKEAADARLTWFLLASPI